MKKAFLLGLAVSALVLGGCNNEKQASDGKAGDSKPVALAVNTKCPFSGESVNGEVASEYKGQKVAFCCAGCKARFDKASDADKAKLASKGSTK